MSLGSPNVVTGSKYCHLFSSKCELTLFVLQRMSASDHACNNHSVSLSSLPSETGVTRGKAASSASNGDSLPAAIRQCMLDVPYVYSPFHHVGHDARIPFTLGPHEG